MAANTGVHVSTTSTPTILMRKDVGDSIMQEWYAKADVDGRILSYAEIISPQLTEINDDAG